MRMLAVQGVLIWGQGNGNLTSRLVGLIEDPNIATRRMACELILRFGDHASIRKLIASSSATQEVDSLLSNTDRCWSICDALVNFADSSDERIQSMICFEILMHGTERHRETLEKLTKHESESISGFAKFVVQIRYPSPSVLDKALEDSNNDLPAALRRLKGFCQTEDGHIVAISLKSDHDPFEPSLSEADLVRIIFQPTLRKLQLSHSRISDEILQKIGDLKELEHLEISYCSNITGLGFVPLKQLTNLRHLEASSTFFDDAAAIAISELPNLEHLEISDAKVGNTGAKALANIKTLQTIYLGSNHIGDKGIAAFHAHPNLSSFFALAIPLSDRSIDVLLSIPNLQDGNLRGSRFSEKGLERLGSLKRLAQ